MIPVSATGPSTRKSYYSDYGNGYVDVAAPGGDAYDTPDGSRDITGVVLAAYPENVGVALGDIDPRHGEPTNEFVSRTARAMHLRVLPVPAGHVDGVTARGRCGRADRVAVRTTGAAGRLRPRPVVHRVETADVGQRARVPAARTRSPTCASSRRRTDRSERRESTQLCEGSTLAQRLLRHRHRRRPRRPSDARPWSVAAQSSASASAFSGRRRPGCRTARRTGRRSPSVLRGVPDLDHACAVEHDDEVGHAHRREAVRDEHGDAARRLRHLRCSRGGGVALEQRVLGLGIERGRRLVEHEEQRMVAHEAARQRELLPLTERDLDAVVPRDAELRVEPAVQAGRRRRVRRRGRPRRRSQDWSSSRSSRRARRSRRPGARTGRSPGTRRRGVRATPRRACATRSTPSTVTVPDAGS